MPIEANSSFPRAVDRPMSLGELIARLDATEPVHGDLDTRITAVASPAQAAAGSLAFCRLPASPAARTLVEACAASVVVATFEPAPAAGRAVVVAADPTAWFIRALGVLFDFGWAHDIDPSARIAADAQIATPVQIGPGAVIEPGCRIGAHTRIGAQVHLGPGTVVGEHVLIQSHASLGGPGLGYHLTAEGERLFFPHLGVVRIGDHAVVGAGTVAARGELSDTVIGARVRLGNLVNIGHNVHIGEGTVISSGACVAGGAHLGPQCQLGVGVLVNAKLRVGAGCRIGLGTVVTKSLPDGASVFGNPARSLPTMEAF